jgi:hypothetical protein
LLVLAFYAWTARPTVSQMGMWTQENPTGLDPAKAYYNLLVQGFRHGHLYLQKDAPAGLAKLTNLGDPNANYEFRVTDQLHDLSYYKGRLYIYFGVTPALLLFWPYAALTGHYLFHKQAAAIFCSVGFLISVVLLGALRRRYFPEVSGWAATLCVLAVGLIDFVPIMLQRPDIWEVPISCGYALQMCALVGIWQALHHPTRRWWWLAAASLAYGLAVGARPNLLLGAAVLLVPVLHVWITSTERGCARCKAAGQMLAAATMPISLVGIGLMAYNYMRFDSPFEFGSNYQLAGSTYHKLSHMFGINFVWFNFQTYFTAFLRWNGQFPYVVHIALPPIPAGKVSEDGAPFGVLTNLPFALLIVGLPFAWEKRKSDEGLPLRFFVAAIAILTFFLALSDCLYAGSSFRYQVDFVPELMMLAACGVFGFERALAQRPSLRVFMRGIFTLALAVSLAVCTLVGYAVNAQQRFNDGMDQLVRGQAKVACEELAESVHIDPRDLWARLYYIVALQQAGYESQAISQYQEIAPYMRLFPVPLQKALSPLAQKVGGHQAHQ